MPPKSREIEREREKREERERERENAVIPEAEDRVCTSHDRY